MVDILQPDPTPYERAIEIVSAERWPVDADALRRAQDPALCPPHLLPYLAHNRGVTLWFDDWSEARKRQAISVWPMVQKHMGKLWAIRACLGLVDVAITYHIEPPADGYFGDIVSPEEHAEWLAKLPQIRMYPFRDVADVLEGEGYVDDDMLFADDDPEGTYFDIDDELTGQRLFIWYRGSEEPLKILSRSIVYRAGRPIERLQVSRPIEIDTEPFDDEVFDEALLDDLGAPGVLTMELAPDPFKGNIMPVPFSERAITTGFEFVSQAVPVLPDEFFFDVDFLFDEVDSEGALWGEDMARELVYRRAYLSDPNVAAPEIDGDLCFDDHIWDFPAYTLLIGIDTSEPIADGDDRFTTGESPFDDGYFDEDSTNKLDRALAAIRASQGDTDVVIADPVTFRPLKFGDAPRAGAGFKFGQMIERTYQ